MAQTLGRSNMHIVFSTKDREPLINEEFERNLYPYIGGICRSLKCSVQVINGMPDHIHILLEQHRTISLSDLVSKIKSNSSRWAKGHLHASRDFAWQRGYGYFSVGRQQFEAVRKYIMDQKEHHKTMGFQDEMRSAYKQMKIDFDEKYVWD